MSQDEIDRSVREPSEELARKPHEPADVEAHLRGHEPAEELSRRPHEPAEDEADLKPPEPDVEAHMRVHGPPLIENPERRIG
jgi:hypothetical protein